MLHYNSQFYCDAVGRSTDPTGTMDIRRKFTSVIELRFRKVRLALQQSVIERDILGLKPASMSPIAMAGSPGNKEIAFQTWLDTLLKQVVVEDGQWMRPHIAMSYNRAIVRGQRLTGTKSLPIDMTETIDALVALCYIELQGIVEAVSQRIMRTAIHAWLHNDKPPETFAAMGQAIATIGVVRADAMVDLMVVKAFTTGTLDQFEAAKVKQVRLIAELLQGGSNAKSNRRDSRRVTDADDPKKERRNFGLTGPGSRISRESGPSASTIRRIEKAQKKLEEESQVNVATAGDEKVCQQCEDIEGDGPYSIDEARSLIPAHPHCRCAFVVEKSKDTEEDSRTVFDEFEESAHPRAANGQFGEGGGRPASGTPKERASEFRQSSKGTDDKLNAAIVADIPGLKLEHTDDVSKRDLHEAVAHVAADSNEMKGLLANSSISVKPLTGLRGVQKGKTIYISSAAFKEHGPGYASGILRHELEHKRLEQQKVPNSEQERRVQHTAGMWAAQRYGSIAKTNPKAAAGFKIAAREQGVKVL